MIPRSSAEPDELYPLAAPAAGGLALWAMAIHTWWGSRVPISYTCRGGEEADYRRWDSGADRGYRVAFCRLSVDKPVQPPADTLDGIFRLQSSKLMIRYSKPLQLAGTEEVADARTGKLFPG